MTVPNSPSDERPKIPIFPAGRRRSTIGGITETSRPVGGGASGGIAPKPAERNVYAARLDSITARQWSGPSKALQFHLDLYDSITRLWKWAEAHEGHPIRESELPFGLLQRLRLLQSSEAYEGAVAHEVLSGTMAGLRGEYDDLALSETHYVSGSVMASVTAAAESALPEPIFPTDLPCPRGLMVFEFPLMIDEVGEDGQIDSGVEIPVRAISWSMHEITKLHDDGSVTTAPGIRYVLYNSFGSMNFEAASITTTSTNEPDKRVTDVVKEAQDLQYWVIEQSGWSFGSAWSDAGWVSADDMTEGQVHGSAAFLRRWLLSYFRWTWQRIIVPTIHRPGRAERRRGLRGGLTMEDGYIKVMRLRREVEHTARFDRGEESDEFTFDHQFMVRGHWRRQWYKSLGPAQNPDGSFNHDSHRMVWIEPFIKGNPYGPLIIGHDVSAAVR
jgi:hypothetical protein